MAKGIVRAGLIGVGGFGHNVLQAVCRSDRVELVGLSDRDPQAAEAAAAGASCASYSDHRRLLVETRPEAVFLAVPPAASAELVRLVASMDLHVWQAPPLARNLPEAVQLCRLMERAGRRFAVGLQRRFMTTYRHARRRLGELGACHLLQGRYLCNYAASTGWRGDKDAGGGALMELGYHVFDLVTWLLGLPETVYAVVGALPAGSRPSDQPVYDTDDTATAVFRYAADASATVVASRRFSPVDEGLTAYCEGGSLAVGPDRCTLRDRDGTVLDSLHVEETPGTIFRRMVDAFAEAVASEGTVCPTSGWEGLLAMAAVDAAYLSDRTHQPESPEHLLRGYDVSASDCLKAVPPEERRDGADAGR